MKQLLITIQITFLFYWGMGQTDSSMVVFEYLHTLDQLVLLKNDNEQIPIKSFQNNAIGLMEVGMSAFRDFEVTLRQYTTIHDIAVPKLHSTAEADEWAEKTLGAFDMVILAINDHSFSGIAPYITNQLAIQAVLNFQNTVTVVFGGQLVFSAIPEVVEKSETLIVSPYNTYTHSLSAQLIMGGIGAKGHLTRMLPGTGFSIGDGKETLPLDRLQFSPPEIVGMNTQLLQDSIKKIVQEGIAARAYPGAQVLVAKDGHIIYQEAFGYHTYDSVRTVSRNDLYDFASLTKVTAALPALMQLHGEGKFSLEDQLSDYLPYFKNSNKSDLTFRKMLAHHAQLLPWIPYWRSTIRGNAKYPWKKRWDNDNYNNFKFKWKTFKPDSTKRFNIRVTDDLWLHRKYQKRIYKAIKKSPLNENPGYVYSGLLFYLLPDIVSNLTQTEFETYLKENIYQPIGAHTIGYNPYLKFPKDRIVPTEKDTFFRMTQIHGTVHDEGAAMMGGISSNAGLFSTIIDLAKLMQTYLNEGSYGGQQILPPESVREFTKCQFCEEGNRRGLGFDKPLIEYNANASSVAKSASPLSFGHSGYTGTFAWADPEHDLLFIFFSNRVYPTRENRKLYTLSIRPRIHQVLYNAMNHQPEN